MADLPFSPFLNSKDLIFFSGKIELTSEGKLQEGTIAEKTKQVMKNVKTELKKAGLKVSDIVFSQVFLTDMKDYQEFNDEYIKHLEKPYPARFVVAVKELPLGASVEISVIASKNN
ncbi:Rid family hydrolase [Patescibacteria group bacterium]